MNQGDDIISREKRNLYSQRKETEWNGMTVIAISLVGIFAYYVIRTYVWQYRARLRGVDAEAYVSWIEHTVRFGGGDGAEYPMTYYYVRFQRYDGLETEARLLNPGRHLGKGSRVRIRYIPGHDDIATLMEIRDEREKGQ